MQNPEFELFCQLMYAEYCDEKMFNKETVTLRYSEYRIRNMQFLKEEYKKKYGSVPTIHSQE
jgi:hypothetical protein